MVRVQELKTGFQSMQDDKHCVGYEIDSNLRLALGPAPAGLGFW